MILFRRVLFFFDRTILFHSRYPSSVLPQSEENLKKFLEKCWLEKENILKEFNANGTFPNGPVLRKNNRTELYSALFFWTVLPVVVSYLFLANIYFRCMVMLHTALLILINVISGGFQDFEIAVYDIKKKLYNFFLAGKKRV